MELDLQSVISAPKKILIIPAVNNDFDIISSGVALAYYMKQQKKNVTLCSQFLSSSKNLCEKITADGINVTGTTVIKNYQISIKPKVQINSLDYETGPDETVLNLSTGDNSNLSNNNLNVTEQAAAFDLTIVLGTDNPESLGLFYAQNRQLFTPDRYILITENLLQDKLFNVVLIENNNYSSNLFNYMQTLKPFPDGAVLTWLLAGIIWRTQGFKSNYYRNQFLDVSELISLGANYKKAMEINLKTVSAGISGIQKIIWQNFTSNENGLFWSMIPKAYSLDEIIIDNHLFSFAENPECRIAILIIEKENYKQVYIKSSADETGLKRLVISLGGKGNNRQGMFTTILSDIEIINTIESSLFTQKPEPVSQANHAEDIAVSKPSPDQGPEPESAHKITEGYDPLAPAKEALSPLDVNKL